MKRLLAALLLIVCVLAAAVTALNLRGEDPLDAPDAVEAAQGEQTGRAGRPGGIASNIERGRYLALVGNCAGCHTDRGGASYAGGMGIDTPFGTVYASNLTPDRDTGIGRWSAAEFWRAMHNGRSRDGRLLYPVFPYPNYTRITRSDSDAIFAWLSTLAPVARANTGHALRFPYGSQAALAVWRALFFQPGTQEPDPAKDATWNRGAYLVNALGHCNACHAGRNFLGATSGTLDLSGGLIPMQNWYAPSLSSPREAGVADWPTDDVVRLLASGVSPGATVLGPMASVVFRSTQHLLPADQQAMAVYLKSLPRQAAASSTPDRSGSPGSPAGAGALSATLERGTRIYDDHCAQCHGEKGEGVAGMYSALAGNRAVVMEPPANLVHVVLGGGFAPATRGNPRPFGMPPYATVLSDAEIAAVITTIRNSWGNRASPVNTADIHRYRASRSPGD